jgi:NADH-quinone oxidoreductase subunit L
MVNIAWLIPVLPLLSFICLLFLRKVHGQISGWLGTIITGISFVLSAFVFIEVVQNGGYSAEWTWVYIGSINISFGILINSLNSLMLILVAFISFLIHLYSIGYMKGDKRISVYFAYLALFTSAMLGLVISSNLLQFYMFWELVGLGSFLLIGFYFYKNSAKQAAKKAFIVTRIGDMGLLVGLILLFWQTGTLDFMEIYAAIDSGQIEAGMITLIAILIFIGAVGKSGQFPLHTWLPDAMEGPTPVSALIHAATMVAAGVYLVAVMYPLYMASSFALMVVAVVGGFTAIYAASIGLAQNDIKQVLAYSTISQLGYMMLAMGVLGYTAGVFHLFTHAFFKALLFLAAGAVIYALHTQNIKEMGGLHANLKLTSIVFLIGALAISGFPLLSGFFSKEEILGAVWADGNYGLFVIALLAAFITSLYMFRLYFLVFHGERKEIKEIQSIPITMKIPMVILAIFALFAGFIQTPWFGTYLGDFLHKSATFLNDEHTSSIWVMLLAIIVSLGGIAFAYYIYIAKRFDLEGWKTAFSGTHQLLQRKYYMDEFYDATVVKGTRGIGYLLSFFEQNIVRGFVGFIYDVIASFSKTTSKSQNGQVQTYGAVAFLGIVILMAFYMMKGGY